jgi:cell division protein FtsI (penicillin-binding protein 3)
MTAKTLRARIQISLFLAAIPVIPIISRLFYLQALEHKKLSAAASREFARTVSETGPRGRIFDSQGALLAESITTWKCSLFKKEFVNAPGALDSLAAALDIPAVKLLAKYRKSKSFVSVQKDIDRAHAEAVKSLKLKGVLLEAEQDRYYPSGNIARNILGITASDRGLTGIERLYNEVLTGRMSRREIVRDNGGRKIYSNETEDEAAPQDLYLTLDANIQFFAQETIKKYAEKNRSDLAMVIVQDPGTGKILALATYPEDLEKIPPVEWVYEPGSTFKAITLAAALEKGVVSAKDTFDCENGAWALNSEVTIHDHEPEKTLTLSGVIERSSNIGSAKIGLKLGLKDFYSYIRAFGFGTPTGLGFPGESAGILRQAEKYRTVDLAVGSYGHGIAATPIQVVNAYSALANGGELLETRLLDRIAGADGKVTVVNKTEVVRRAVSRDTADAVKEILVRAVDAGTGKNAAIPGYAIAGKTGTSKKIDPRTGQYVSNKNVASFCGFFPADKPRYTILVILDNPKLFYYGGETAAPAFQEIAKKIITLKGIRPDRVPDKSRAPAAPVTD